MPYRPDSPEHAREVFEQQRDGHLKRLRSCLEDWSDEIPVEIVHNEGNAKVRSAWFALVVGRIELALEFLNDSLFSKEIDNELDPIITEAQRHAGFPEGQNRNTKEQVDACNLILQKVIERLEKAS